jgi:hypothetical protein
MNGFSTPKHFLLRDDLEECAEHVSRIVRHCPRQNRRYNLFVAEDGAIRVIPVDSTRQNQRPDRELVAVYDSTTRIERIEDDLLARKRELNDPKYFRRTA